jgi:hypothetical protein
MADLRGAIEAASRNQYTRPTLRESTKQIVRGLAPVEARGGVRYYVSATDDKVLIPVIGKYPESVTKLPIVNNPKSGKPEYFVDAATGMKYPVNPPRNSGIDQARSTGDCATRRWKRGGPENISSTNSTGRNTSRSKMHQATKATVTKYLGPNDMYTKKIDD